MLRVSVLNDSRGTTLKLEGKLAHEWVAEAGKAWSALSEVSSNECVLVDLFGVSFVDDSGRELLAQMHASGAKLVGTGPMTGALIEEICGNAPSSASQWIRSILSVLFLLVLMSPVPGQENDAKLNSMNRQTVSEKGVTS